VFAGSMSADVDPANALGRSGCDLIKRTTDIDRLIPVVDTGFNRVCFYLGSVLTQCLDVFFGEFAVWIN